MTNTTELAQSLKAAAEKWQEAWGKYDKVEITIAEFIRAANQYESIVKDPANILALVEALEKSEKTSEARREAIDRTFNMFVRERDRASAAEEVLEKTQAKNALVAGDIEAAAKLHERIAELESRTVMLPPELYTIGELIRTQDNRITDQPMFVVFQKREIIGSDEHSPSRVCWVWDGEEVSELRAKRLEALYQDGRDTRGYDRYAMQEVDEFVTACFTEHGCKDYLRQNGHNLRLPYIYACGSFRNNEYQLVRNWLAGIKVEAE